MADDNNPTEMMVDGFLQLAIDNLILSLMIPWSILIPIPASMLM